MSAQETPGSSFPTSQGLFPGRLSVPRSYLALPALNSSTVARYFLTVLAATICFATLTTVRFPQANVKGSWQTLPNLMPINPVHAALLHNGKVLVVSGSGNVAANTHFQAGIDRQSVL